MGVIIMTNKEKLISAIDKDINPKKNYNEIINKIERGEKMNQKNNNLWKWSFVPICLVAILSCVLLINNNKELKPNIYKPEMDNVNLYINDMRYKLL